MLKKSRRSSALAVSARFAGAGNGCRLEVYSIPASRISIMRAAAYDHTHEPSHFFQLDECL